MGVCLYEVHVCFKILELYLLFFIFYVQLVLFFFNLLFNLNLNEYQSIQNTGRIDPTFNVAIYILIVFTS